MNRTTWIQLERWYQGRSQIQRWAVWIGLGLVVFMLAAVVTHEPRERPRPPKIIKNCDHCGTDPERTMTYNEYQDQREQAQRRWFGEERARIQQDVWNERGRARWCREHPQDRNCRP